MNMTAQQKKGLGKGLSALMSEEYSSFGEQSASQNSLKLSQLKSGRYQPRSHFEDTYLQELAASIKKNGIMQPILVRAADDEDNYEIVAGERRWRAAKIAGLEEVPVLIRDIDDKQALELALVENIQRQDLTPVEEALGFQRLIDEFSYTQEELASTVGKSRSHIANMLRLLNLPEKVRIYLDEQKISAGHARALLNAKNPEELIEEVVKRGLNVRQTENLCRSGLPNFEKEKQEQTTQRKNDTPARRSISAKDKDPDIVALEETLSQSIGLKVSINDNGQHGEVLIRYESLVQLDDILKRLGGNL
jgi:ParB family chromosome partitioning protein